MTNDIDQKIDELLEPHIKNIQDRRWLLKQIKEVYDNNLPTFRVVADHKKIEVYRNDLIYYTGVFIPESNNVGTSK